jgi:hypothetical protein
MERYKAQLPNTHYFPHYRRGQSIESIPSLTTKWVVLVVARYTFTLPCHLTPFLMQDLILYTCTQ